MPILPRDITKRAILNHVIKIVDTIIMAKIGLPCLILFNAPLLCLFPLTRFDTYKLTDGRLFTPHTVETGD